jgi:hypothetical protein
MRRDEQRTLIMCSLMMPIRSDSSTASSERRGASRVGDGSCPSALAPLAPPAPPLGGMALAREAVLATRRECVMAGCCCNARRSIGKSVVSGSGSGSPVNEDVRVRWCEEVVKRWCEEVDGGVKRRWDGLSCGSQ